METINVHAGKSLKKRPERLELCGDVGFFLSQNFDFLIRLAVENWGK